MATVKTAISLPEALFEQAQTLADELSISRSRLFTLAVEAFVQRYENERLLASLNEAYGDGLDEAEIDMLNQMRLNQLHLIEGDEDH
jgi:hypothetical protein